MVIQISALSTQICKDKCKNGESAVKMYVAARNNIMGVYCELTLLDCVVMIIAWFLVAVPYFWRNPVKMPRPLL